MAASAWRPITIMANLSADLRQRMREYAHQLGLPAFWRWWTAQLAPLVPASPRAALKRRLLRPVLAFAPDVAVLWVPRTTNGTLSYAASARIPLAGDPAVVQQAGRAVIDALPRISYGAGPPVAKVVVALPLGQVLRKELRLPTAVEQDLKQALAYDLDRHTPFKPDELHFDAAVVGRDAQRGEIRVDWAAALRSVVTEARRRAESWGATVVAVTPDAPGDDGPATSRRLAAQPAAGGRASRGCVVAPLAALGAARAGRGRASDRHPVADLAKARLRDRVVADHQSDAGPGRRRERASPAARADDRRLQLRARQEVRIPEPGAGAERRDEAPPGRHLAHATRGEERVRRARSRGASSCCAARAPTPAGSSRCSRKRRRSSTPRRGRRRPRSSPAPGRYSTSGRSSRRRRLRRPFNSRARRSTRRRPLPRPTLRLRRPPRPCRRRRPPRPQPRQRRLCRSPRRLRRRLPSRRPQSPPTRSARRRPSLRHRRAIGLAAARRRAPPPTVVNGQVVNSGAIPGTAPRPVEKAQP